MLTKMLSRQLFFYFFFLFQNSLVKPRTENTCCSLLCAELNEKLKSELALFFCRIPGVWVQNQTVAVFQFVVTPFSNPCVR